jgi:Ca-activated chloride channel family protein
VSAANQCRICWRSLKQPTSRAPTGSAAFRRGSNNRANIQAKLESNCRMKFFGFIAIIFFAFTVQAQNFEREFPLHENASLKITNLHGRVTVIAQEVKTEGEAEKKIEVSKAFLAVSNARESDIKIVSEPKRLEILVQPNDQKSRIDLTIKVPAWSKIKVETGGGEVRLEGSIESAEIKTETGTIAANVPLDDLKYDFVWTDSRPRFLSDVELEEADEKAAGKFVINGKLGKESEKEKKDEREKKSDETEDNELDTEENKEQISEGEGQKSKGKKKKTKTRDQKTKTVKLNFTTARGIILLNVNPNEVPSNLTERPLTEAAKAIIRSGDSLLTEAIRRASPKYFGEYARTLPPRKSLPTLSESKGVQKTANSQIKRVLVRVTDLNNRAVGDLKKEDFEVLESNENREILSVEPTTAPFNLVLLLDVSGSVDNYVDFIRKTARNFVNTVSASDKIAIIIFNEDVKNLSTFTTDKGKLSESLDTFDAGGSTAFYDALAYTLADTLRPLKGERTAIVVLSDGDDNRSFLPFDALLGSVQESGALVYPLYVPSGLIAASANNNPNSSIDPLRSRYMALTTKSEAEGEKLAQISGGIYYPISQINQLQKAYDDIVAQLRTAYSITFRSDVAEIRDTRAAPRLKVKVKRENSFVKLGSVVEVSGEKTGSVKSEF